MGIFFWKNEEKKTEANVPVNEAKKNSDNVRRFILKAIGLIVKQGSGRENFEAPEYDLTEIKLASEADSYVKQAIAKYSYLIFKAGYQIKSENDLARLYIKKRFRLMSYMTEKPIDILFQEIGDDLNRYSNAFLVKSRADLPTNLVKAKGLDGNKAVGGYFRIDPSTVSIRRDEYGKIIQYMQTVNGVEKTYKKQDFIHMYLDKDPNNNFGTPRFVAALEDVKLLRKIEGNVVSLIYRFAIPIYQWIVGTAEPGMQASQNEIDDVEREIANMSLDGSIVTNERTQVKAIGAEGSALDASAYMKYFENRAFTALGVSETQMGRGGSKKDADAMEAQAHDTVKHIQRTMSIFIENLIINELLIEGGFDPILNDNDNVRFEFNEISLETKIKTENHEILKFQSNVIEDKELRKSLGLKEDTDEKRLYANMITLKGAIDTINAQKKATIEINKFTQKESSPTEEESTSNNLKGNGTIPTSKPNNDANNRNRPQNQHGVGSVKIKESEQTSPNIHDPIKENKKVFQDVYKKWAQASNDMDRSENYDIILSLLETSLIDSVKKELAMTSIGGKEKAIADIKTNNIDLLSTSINLEPIETHVETIIAKLIADIKEQKDKDKESNPMDRFAYRLNYLKEFILSKTYWYSYASVCKNAGIKEIEVDFAGSEDEKEHAKVIRLNELKWHDVPAFHSYCSCKLKQK